MYNANYPKENELPSTKQLLTSTLIALITAIAILLVAVLPAEYGIDPTGLGQALGLKPMGEIKVQLAKEAMLEAKGTPTLEVKSEAGTETKRTPTPAVSEAPAETSIPAAQPHSAPEVPTPLPSDSITLSLKPGEAAEVKLDMQQHARVNYEWHVDTGHLNYDTHGDRQGTKYHNYNKGKAKTGDSGTLEAAFDGSHGWFWRNRSKELVTVTLSVSGEFSAMKRVL